MWQSNTINRIYWLDSKGDGGCIVHQPTDYKVNPLLSMHGVAIEEFCIKQPLGSAVVSKVSLCEGGWGDPRVCTCEECQQFLKNFVWDFQQCSLARFAIICSVAAPSFSDHYLMPRPFPLSVIDLLLTIWSLSWPRSLPIIGRDGN